MKPLACGDVDQLLGAHLISALDQPDQTALDVHLNGCGRHQGSIDQLTQISDELLLTVQEREPRPELRARIMDAIHTEATPISLSLGWSAQRLALGSHACVFHSDDTGLKQSMGFLRVGLDQPEEFGVVFADKNRFGSLTEWLQDGYAGSVASLIERGKLAMIGGAPHTDDLIETIGGRLDQALREGYRVIRLLGFIGWDQPGWPDAPSIVEFERRVNAVCHVYPAVVVCTYDVSRLGAISVLDGGLRNHPITIMGHRIVRQNPFYLAA